MSSEKSTRTRTLAPANKDTSKIVRRKPCGEKHIIGFLFAICCLLTIFLAIVLSLLVALRIPDLRTIAHYKPLQTSYILDRNGNVIERIYTENRTLVQLADMPDLLAKAFVAAEDGRFFEHPGLDFFSVLRAVIVNIHRGGRAQGGSTITQQVARSLLLTREKTYLRKFKEAVLAWRIDSMLSKDDILYIYLNQIYLGGGAHGVEAAAQVYFGKHVQALSLSEIAILAGLPQAPSKYSPFDQPLAALARQRYVLNRMAADGYITSEEARLAFNSRLQLQEKTGRDYTTCGYYNNIVKNRARKLLGVPLMHAGVKIYTYLDLKMQEAAVAAVRSGVEASKRRRLGGGGGNGKAPQGALVSVDACRSEVLALVGGTDFAMSPFDRAAMARRQAGSAFKPIIFSAALSSGLESSSPIMDAPLSIAGGKGKRWSPQNYTGQYHGEVTLSYALAHSLNTAAVRLLQKVGLNPVHKLSKRLGISSALPKDLSLALGSLDVSLLELTASYTPFICSGKYRSPVFIDRIEKADGTIIREPRGEKKPVLSPQVSLKMSEMLSLVISDGTGSRAQGLAGLSGGKTGTSNESRDAWFIGYNGGNMTGVWVGFDHNDSLGPGENGGRTAAPIWLEFMKKTSELR